MRKLEINLTNSIKTDQKFRGNNTTYNPSTGEVRLHGNLIWVEPEKGGGGERRPKFSLAGWNTTTTRSRLNALLREITPRGFIVSMGQMKHEPHVRFFNARTGTAVVWPIDTTDWIEVPDTWDEVLLLTAAVPGAKVTNRPV